MLICPATAAIPKRAAHCQPPLLNSRSGRMFQLLAVWPHRRVTPAPLGQQLPTSVRFRRNTDTSFGSPKFQPCCSGAQIRAPPKSLRPEKWMTNCHRIAEAAPEEPASCWAGTRDARPPFGFHSRRASFARACHRRYRLCARLDLPLPDMAALPALGRPPRQVAQSAAAQAQVAPPALSTRHAIIAGLTFAHAVVTWRSPLFAGDEAAAPMRRFHQTTLMKTRVWRKLDELMWTHLRLLSIEDSLEGISGNRTARRRAGPCRTG